MMDAGVTCNRSDRALRLMGDPYGALTKLGRILRRSGHLERPPFFEDTILQETEPPSNPGRSKSLRRASPKPGRTKLIVGPTAASRRETDILIDGRSGRDRRLLGYTVAPECVRGKSRYLTVRTLLNPVLAPAQVTVGNV